MMNRSLVSPMPFSLIAVVIVASLVSVIFSVDCYGEGGWTNNCQTWVGDHYETRPCEGGGGGGGTGGRNSDGPSEYDLAYEAYYQAHITASDLYRQGLNTRGVASQQYFQQALEYIEEALRHLPDASKTLHFKRQVLAAMKVNEGDTAVENGDYEWAMRFFDEAQNIYPESSDLWQRHRDWAYEQEYNKALSLFFGESWGEAERHFRGIAPKYGAIAYYYLGVVLNNQGKVSEAEWSYRQTIKLDPDNSSSCAAAYGNLASLLAKQQRYAEAEAAYRQAIKLHPKDADTINNLGVMLEEQGRYEEARTAYQKALGVDPNVEYAASNLKSLEDKIRRHEEAKKDVIVVERIQGDIDTLITDIGNNASPGQPQSIYRTVNGEQVEFTVEPHPQEGPGSAGDQLLSNVAAGQTSIDASKLEISSDRAQLGFDTPAAPAGSLPVLGSGTGKSTPGVPDAFKKDPEILQYQAERQVLDQRDSYLGSELEAITGKIEKLEGLISETEKGQLQVQKAAILDQMAAVKSQKATLEVHIQDRVRKLTFSGIDLTPAQAKTKSVPPPAPSGNTRE